MASSKQCTEKQGNRRETRLLGKISFVHSTVWKVLFGKGVVENAGFQAVVTAHFFPVEGQQQPRTTILIKFAEEVLRREARLG